MAIDYEQVRQGFLDKKKEIEARQSQISQQIAGLNDEHSRNHRELIMIDEVLESLDFTKDAAPDDLEEVGLTEKVKRILQESTIPLSPTQIRDVLLMQGYKATSLKHALISVHTVLDRIEPFIDQVEVDKRKAYKWKEPETMYGLGLKDALLNTTENRRGTLAELAGRPRPSLGKRILEGARMEARTRPPKSMTPPPGWKREDAEKK
jgi:hypothetical protein